MSGEAVFDPGRKWRRRVRWGALLCSMGTLVPADSGWQTLWGALDEIWKIAINRDRENALVIIFCCLSVPAMFGGPVMLFAARLSKGVVGRSLQVWLTGGLFVASVAPPCYFFGFHLRQFTQDEAPALIGIAGFILFLAASGLCVLHARDKRKGPLCVFPLGILPLGMAMVAWWAIGAWIIVDRSKPELLLLMALTSLGSTLQFVAWLCWWRAVKKETTALTTPSPPAPASSTSPPA